MFINASDAANLGGLLTPKSPDSPTNPFARDLLAPPSPLSPRRSTWGWMDGAGNDEDEDEDAIEEPEADQEEGNAGLRLGLNI